ncbi:hypothetical protein, partial [Bordetella pertussis]|uniref:hypothetical protein n=1 Tax=Bordetella pertussis TaxID=520 RepID=UPI0006DCC681
LVPALAALAAVLLAADRHIDWIALQPWPGAAPVGACNISIDTHVEIVKITTKTGPYGRSLHLLDRHL